MNKTMKSPKLFLTTTLLALAALIAGCNDRDTPSPLNEEELITTLKLSFAKWDEQGNPSNDPLEFYWKDADASGNPDIDNILLETGATYSLSVEVMDESKSPVVDITEEIVEEADEHQFFFQAEGVSIAFEYNDLDNQNMPVGLETVVSTNNPGTGSLTVILRHEPDKKAPGVADGDITNAGGETDIEATFPLSVTD